MHAIAEMERAVEKTRAAVHDAADRIERSPRFAAVEQYARATALLFGRLVAQEVMDRLAQMPPATPIAVIELLDAAVAAAWEALLRRQDVAPEAVPPAPAH